MEGEKVRYPIVPDNEALRRWRLQELIDRHLSVLNNLEPHLGCVKCGSPLKLLSVKNRSRYACNSCQPGYEAELKSRVTKGLP